MGHPIAFFKGTRLGDFLRGPVSHEAVIQETQFARTGWGNSATPIAAGAGGTFRHTLRSVLWRGHHTAAETHRQFAGRKLDFVANVRAVAGYQAGSYSQRGHLSVVQDDESDVTTLVLAPTPGSSTTCEVAANIGFAVNDRVLIYSVNGYDACRVVAYSHPTLTLDQVAVNHPDGTTPIYRLLFSVPECHLQRGPTVPGHDVGTNTVSLDMEMVFESADGAAYSLA